jgi:hypothetical protein
MQGLRELYQFKQAHPEADFTVFMMGISKFYQSYIERGLKWAEAEATASTQGENEGTIENDFNVTNSNDLICLKQFGIYSYPCYQWVTLFHYVHDIVCSNIAAV